MPNQPKQKPQLSSEDYHAFNKMSGDLKEILFNIKQTVATDNMLFRLKWDALIQHAHEVIDEFDDTPF